MNTCGDHIHCLLFHFVFKIVKMASCPLLPFCQKFCFGGLWIVMCKSSLCTGCIYHSAVSVSYYFHTGPPVLRTVSLFTLFPQGSVALRKQTFQTMTPGHVTSRPGCFLLVMLFVKLTGSRAGNQTIQPYEKRHFSKRFALWWWVIILPGLSDFLFKNKPRICITIKARSGLILKETRHLNHIWMVCYSHLLVRCIMRAMKRGKCILKETKVGEMHSFLNL